MERRPIIAATLAETIVALFILVYVFIVVANLTHRGLAYGGQSASLARSALFAETLLAEMRAWAFEPVNFDSDWSTQSGLRTHPDFPGLTANVHVICNSSDPDASRRELYSPCSSIEFGQAHPRVFRNSCVWVQVSVPLNSTGSRNLELVTLIGEPWRELNPVLNVSRSGPADPIPYGDVVNLGATLSDGAVTILEPMFEWGVLPYTVGPNDPGNATLRPTTRDGRASSVRNQTVLNPDPAAPDHWAPAPGGVLMEARTRFQGRLVTGSVNGVMAP